MVHSLRPRSSIPTTGMNHRWIAYRASSDVQPTRNPAWRDFVVRWRCPVDPLCENPYSREWRRQYGIQLAHPGDAKLEEAEYTPIVRKPGVHMAAEISQLLSVELKSPKYSEMLASKKRWRNCHILSVLACRVVFPIWVVIPSQASISVGPLKCRRFQASALLSILNIHSMSRQKALNLEFSANRQRASWQVWRK